MSADLSVKLAAQAVAMGAMINDLDGLAVEDMRSRAEELLSRDDPFYRAITGFATQYQLASHDPAALAMQGRILRDAVLDAAGGGYHPRERRDIDG